VGSIARFGSPFSSKLVICGHRFLTLPLTIDKTLKMALIDVIVQELCESRGGRPGLSVLTSLLVSDVKIY